MKVTEVSLLAMLILSGSVFSCRSKRPEVEISKKTKTPGETTKDSSKTPSDGTSKTPTNTNKQPTGSTNKPAANNSSVQDLNTLQAPAAGTGVLVRVTNKCPFKLWIHGAGKEGVLQPDDSLIETNQRRTYLAPASWESARVEAYKNGPRQNQIDKVEATFVKSPNNGIVLNYNVTYVDWVGLPVEVSTVGGGGDCKAAGCSLPVAKLLEGCPEQDLNDGERCYSPRTYCLNPANSGKAFCKIFDAKISECAQKYPDCKGAAGATTPEVFACSGAFFSQSPKYCAAINRGMLNDPDNANISLYHKNAPFNTYSKWVHDVCPGIYALAYDDYPPAAEESGFHACTEGKEMLVTFCPGG